MLDFRRFYLMIVVFLLQISVAHAVGADPDTLFSATTLAIDPNSWNDWPIAGNPSGGCSMPIPAEAGEEDTSSPDHIIGNGTPQSCTSDAVVATIAQGGIISFNCGPDPIIIHLQQTAKIFNDTGPKIVIDGKGKVALSGSNVRRILYMNTCDQAQVWTTSHCQDQDHPQLTVQNLTFLEGNSSDQTTYDGGGAIWARGGRLKIVNSRFFKNSCAATGPDVGGAAVRAFSQSQNKPLYVVNSTFGGRSNLGNSCSNGGGLSSIGVSYSIYNSFFSYNKAIGYGANPARAGTPGGGSGGAIYNDGNTFDLNICGTRIENNSAREGGGAIFFVSNDRSGHLLIRDSWLSKNPSAGFETAGYPGIFYLGSGSPQISNVSFAAANDAAIPQTGWWWNPSQSGLGFMIERQGSKLLVVGGYYAADGRATWYYSYGPMAGTSYAGDLTTYSKGQTLTGGYVAAVGPASVGTISLSFSDAAHGTVTAPGGAPMAIERFNIAPGGVGAAPASFQPETGSWWNTGESGRGFAVEIQNGQMFVAGYMYDSAGKPIWYTSGGTMVAPSVYRGNWMQWANGPTLGGAYVAPIVINANVGNVTLTFSSETAGTLTLPDGRSIPLTRFFF